MGYTTRFKGTLKFTCEMTAPMLAKLNSYFGEDSTDHPELGVPKDKRGYIDLVMSKDFSGIEWDTGTEKTYHLEDSVDALIRVMKSEYPQFGLSGYLDAQGEDVDDRWQLFIDDDGRAKKRDVPVPGIKIECPDCGHVFRHQVP